MVVRNRNLPGSPEARRGEDGGLSLEVNSRDVGVRELEGEVQERETDTLQEQLTFNEARKGQQSG